MVQCDGCGIRVGALAQRELVLEQDRSKPIKASAKVWSNPDVPGSALR